MKMVGVILETSENKNIGKSYLLYYQLPILEHDNVFQVVK